MFEQGATPQKATCSPHTQTEEEDAVVQEETNSDKLDEVRPMKTKLITDKTVDTHEECSKERGVVMSDQANKTTPSNVDIVEK